MDSDVKFAEAEMIHAKDLLDQQYWRFTRQARGNPVPMVALSIAYNLARDRYMALARESRSAA
jgi:hypothetical protein